MLNRFLTSVFLSTAIACASAPAKLVPPAPVPPPVQLVHVAITVSLPVAGVHVTLGPTQCDTNERGIAICDPVPRTVTSMQVVVPDGYLPVDDQSLALQESSDVLSVTIVAKHFDPSFIPLRELAAIRGAMWTARLNLPYGPRPNQDDNILAMDFYQLYDASTRARMLQQYHDQDGYTHAVTGPVSGTDCYHGQYPCHDPSNPGWFPQDGPPSQAQWDFYLDALQEWWDHAPHWIAPVAFIHPDGWTFEQTRDVFTPLLLQPRAQRLLRIVVPAGWEPARYEWSSCTWVRYFKWARETLPNALVLAHSVTDTDGLVGVDGLCDDNQNPGGVGDGWRRQVPYLHGWLIQNGPYETAPDADPPLAQNFAAQFRTDGIGADQHSVAWHFAGRAGWPTNSAWGDGIPVCLYNAENTSYRAYWFNLPEAASKAWGDLAIASGACGYLDGGSVAVPVTR